MTLEQKIDDLAHHAGTRMREVQTQINALDAKMDALLNAISGVVENQAGQSESQEITNAILTQTLEEFSDQYSKAGAALGAIAHQFNQKDKSK